MIKSCAAIVIAAKHGELTKVKDASGIAYTVGTLRCKFEFRTTDWDYTARTAVFCKGNVATHPKVVDTAIGVLLDGVDECAVPPEVLLPDEKYFSVGVWGATNDGLRIVSEWLVFRIKDGCYVKTTASVLPTPSVYEQILTALALKAPIEHKHDEYVTEELVDRKIANVQAGDVNLNAYALKTDLPKKTSDLENDSGFITSIPEEYITETELNKKGYLTEHQSLKGYAKTTDIPTKVSQLQNDSGYLAEEDVPSWAKQQTPPYASDIADLRANKQDKLKAGANIIISQDGTISASGGGGGGILEESDPTVPDWAKQPTKPTYAYSEITGKPTLGLLAERDSIAYDEIDGAPTPLQLGETSTKAYPGNKGKANADAIAELQENKQDALSFDGTYNSISNKVATVKTVTDKIAEVVAGAPDDLNTLEEIAAWIATHPDSVAAINAAIQANTAAIATNNQEVEKLKTDKQDKLMAGENVTIKDGVISASGGEMPDLSEYVKVGEAVPYPTKIASQYTDTILIRRATGEWWGITADAGDGVAILATGRLIVSTCSEAQIDSRTSKPLSGDKLDYMVRSVFSEKNTKWTDDDKADVRAWLGITEVTGDIETALTAILGV